MTSNRCVQQMPAREDDLKELALDIAAAIVKARQLNLSTSTYILSMVLVEVSEAIEAAEGDGGSDAAQ